MELMKRRRELIAQKTTSGIINLCSAATGTEILDDWSIVSGDRVYILTGLDPTQDYTLQVTITAAWGATTGRRLYLRGAANNYILTSGDTAPVTKSISGKPNADGQLKITHNNPALRDYPEYAASLTKIMLEIGSVAHPYVPYIPT